MLPEMALSSFVILISKCLLIVYRITIKFFIPTVDLETLIFSNNLYVVCVYVYSIGFLHR